MAALKWTAAQLHHAQHRHGYRVRRVVLAVGFFGFHLLAAFSHPA